MDGPVLYAGERPVPESINLNWFAIARRDHPSANFGIHPCQLKSWRPGMQQAIGRINADAIACSTYMAGNDVAEGWKEFFQQRPVAGQRQVGVKSMEHPQGCVHGIILRSFSTVGEAVGDKSMAGKRGKSFEEPASFAVSARIQQQSLQGDHRISAPVCEPGITSNDRFVGGRETDSDISIGDIM